MTTEPRTRWRSTRAESALIVECAVAHQVSARSVRDWRKGNDPRWQKFLAQRSGVLGQLEAHCLRSDLDRPGDPVSEERAALRRFRLLESEIEKAIEGGHLGSIPTITRAAADCHKMLMQCRQAALEWNVHQKRFYPADQFNALVARYIVPIKQALQNLPQECAILCNPTDPALAGAALREWLVVRLEPLRQEAQDAIAAATKPPIENENDHPRDT